MQPLISICIPTYNRVGFLEYCLEHIITQTGYNAEQIEIIISDNASTDDTESLVESYIKEHSNIHYFKNPTNIGANQNMLKVSEYAKGDYIRFMGDDDSILDGGVEIVLDAIKTCNDVICFHTNLLPNNDGLYITDGIACFKETIRKNKISNSIIIITFLSAVIIKREHRIKNLHLCQKKFSSKLFESYAHFYILIRCLAEGKIGLLGPLIIGGEGESRDNFYRKNNHKIRYTTVITNGIDKLYEDMDYLNSIGITKQEMDRYRSGFIKVYYFTAIGIFFKKIGLYDPVKKLFKKLLWRRL